ncbi:MAG: ABC transporter ATP-binding protein [Spirochaetota bacterium]
MEYIVEAHELKKSFGDIKAVDGISFSVISGESFGLLGPNGAGKTSTVRMIYGFSPMTEGSLKVLGLDIKSDWRKIRSQIGVCQQENNLDPDLTVLENLEVFAGYFDIPKKVARERAEELLGFFALSHRKDSPVNELSGGMMRRLVLARALINNPRLLILDEPTTGLDPQSRHQVWERIEQLKKDGISVILTTHNMDEAARLCDRLVIIDHGRILEEGNPRELIRRHVGQYIIEVTEPEEELRNYLLSRKIRFEDLHYRLIVYQEGNEKLFHLISERFCRGGCNLRMSTLEDVFLKLTGRGLRE